MGLNLSTGGDFSPFLKYNAKAGRFFVRADDGSDIEIRDPRMAMDFDTIKTGWILFSQSGPPSFVWDENSVRGACPGKGWKDGFELLVFSTSKHPKLTGVVGTRSWTSNAGATKAGLMSAYRQYEDGKDDHPGCVPIFICNGTELIPGMNGDSFEPVFELESWVEREQITEFPPLTNGTEQSEEDNSASNDLDDEIPF